MKRIFLWILGAIVVSIATVFLLTLDTKKRSITYGVTFTKLYAEELGLDWQEVYRSALDDLQIRKFRLAAHWPMIEPERDRYDFSAMDFQINEAAKRDAEVILAVGRRLPRWPECHVPGWAAEMPWEDQKDELREYITTVVERYKNEKAIVYWQVENEPYLSLFAFEHCGELDKNFLHEEIALVKSLDPSRPVLVTDSGNLGLWVQPYRAGDAFGTSLYMYFWNAEVGPFKTRIPPAFYRLKARVMQLAFGMKPTLLIELAAEPWLVEPTVQASIDTQLSRMDLGKFKEIITYAEKTHFEEQYLWGVEWWYYLRERNHPEMWSYAKTIYQK